MCIYTYAYIQQLRKMAMNLRARKVCGRSWREESEWGIWCNSILISKNEKYKNQHYVNKKVNLLSKAEDAVKLRQIQPAREECFKIIL